MGDNGLGILELDSSGNEISSSLVYYESDDFHGAPFEQPIDEEVSSSHLDNLWLVAVSAEHAFNYRGIIEVDEMLGFDPSKLSVSVIELFDEFLIGEIRYDGEYISMTEEVDSTAKSLEWYAYNADEAEMFFLL